jgi:parallel beta-helix repeat protein
MGSLRIVLLLGAAVVSLAAHEKHAAAGDYSPPREAVVIGEGDFRYRLVPGWATQNAAKYKLGNCNAIAQDSRGRILLLHTSKEHCLIALSPEGVVLDAWGDFTVAAHGLSVVKEKEREVLFISDHSAGGKVYKTTLDGEVIMTISCPMESGLYKKSAEFKPAKTLHLPGGEFFVIDGYGKDYIHRYSAEGKWQSAFGGNLGEGEAQLKHWGPHGGAIDFTDAGNPVMILALSDQQKMKRFKLDGTWLDTKPFPGSNPRDVLLHRDHFFVHHLGDNWPEDRNAPGYISVLDRDLKVIANLGGSAPRYDAEGKLAKMAHTTHLFHHPHGMGIDREGNLYIAQASSNGTWPLKFVPEREQNQGRQEARDKTRTWLVSNRSADGGEGTVARPFRTISEAAEVARAGDTVLVKAGVYRERVAPPRSGVTYRGEQLGRVFIRGSEEWKPDWQRHKGTVFFAVPDESLFGGNLYLDGSGNPFLVELASTPYHRDGKPEAERFKKGDPSLIFTCGQVIVNRRPWQQRPYLREVERQEKTWTYVPETGRIYVNFGGRTPVAQSVEITTRRRIFAPHVRGLGHIVVEGFVMEHCANQYPTNFWNTPRWAQAGALGLRGGHHWIVRNNLIRYANTVAMDVGAGGNDNELLPSEIEGAPFGQDNLIENNYLLDNGAAGLVGSQSTRMIIRGNVILRNNTQGFLGPKRYEHAGIKCHYIRDGVIEGNYVANSPRSDGIWLDNQFFGTRITRNVVVNNGGRGIFLEMSDYKFDAALVDHNISVGNHGIQFYVHDASGSTVMHNLFANSPQDAKYGQGAYIYQVSARTRTGYHSFFNNLFINHRVMLDINYPTHRSGPQRLDHNVYDASPGERTFLINSAADKPSPWQAEEFFALVRKEVGANGPQALHGGAKVALTLEEWRRFWSAHNLPNDRHSITLEGMTATYEEDSLELTISMPLDPSRIGSSNHHQIDLDFLGNAVPQDGTAIPGPLQTLRKGESVIRVWSGLPLLAEGELP